MPFLDSFLRWSLFFSPPQWGLQLSRWREEKRFDSERKYNSLSLSVRGCSSREPGQKGEEEEKDELRMSQIESKTCVFTLYIPPPISSTVYKHAIA